jgi:hypothetical protein
MTVSLSAGGRASAPPGANRSPASCSPRPGFDSVVMHTLPHDAMNYYYVCSK